ncbi:AAA family ATPase [Cetobacterium sp.]|uniref:AAA family ATPase n=1 Tax=Cetobacterium sp. TaxID=2071632 RepID=UPI003F3ACC68
MNIIYFVVFILFVQKKFGVNEILGMEQNPVVIKNTINLFSGICFFITTYLYVKYRSSIKNLHKLIFYFLIIFMIYLYKKSIHFLPIVSFFLTNNLFILFILIFFIPFICPKLLGNNSRKYLLQKNLEKPLYLSRKNKMKLLKQFLNIYNEFSITGEWGIGKSFFLKYFFENLDKKKYEEIIVDISSYSANDGILKKIDSEINKILKKYHIFRFSPSIFKEVNVENSFVETLKNIMLSSLDDNLESCIESLPITIVLCLDNIERLNDVNRITLLFSAIDEQLLHKISNRKKIKVIYLYDRGYMEKIFNKENISFNSYISKYSESEIQIYGIEENDFKENKNYTEIIDIRNSISKNSQNRYGNFIKQWDLHINQLYADRHGITYDSKESYSSEQLEDLKEIKNKIEPLKNNILKEIDNYTKQIEEKLKNPRFIEQCFMFNENSENKLEMKYFIKYKIILDIFQNVNLTSKSVSEIDLINLLQKTSKMNQMVLSLEDIELIIIQFILFSDSRDELKNFICELNKIGLI